jgi:hypothetical protein
MPVVKTHGRGGPRPGAGRPKGSGRPAHEVRGNRVVVMLTDDELAKLKRLAREKGLPVGTVAYEFVGRGLARR